MNAALRLGAVARPLIPVIRKSAIKDPAHKDLSDYVNRMVEYLPARIGE